MEGNGIEANVAAASTASVSLARNRSYLLLLAGQVISQMGDRLAMVAFPWLIYARTGSTLGTGVILALYTLPYVLFGAFAGVLIDRFNKRSVMVIADVLRAGLIALVPIAASWSLPAVYLLSFLMATVSVFFEPTKLTILPEIVAPDRLLRANSLLTTGDNLTEVLGYGLAGAILAALPIATAFRIDAATFLVSALALMLMRYQAPARAAQRAARSFGRELREGMDYLRHHRGMLANTVMVLGAAAGLGASYPLTFFLAVDVLDGGVKAFGIFEAAIGVGFLLGSITVALVATRLRKGLAMTMGLAIMGAALVTLAVAPTVWLATLPFLIVGLANSVVLIAVDTYVQMVVPKELLGRVWGARFALTQGAYAVSVIAAGALAGVFDVRVLFVAAGVLVAVPGIVALFVRQIRDA
ncbi:MAG TPA: MFS transporter [Thermoleophilia bacterium]|nr:MFS transporter [Thermoleophilia bacterium]